MKLFYYLLQTIFSFLIISCYVFPQGKVYLVLGSDTAIWDGMDVSKYNCNYKLDLFTSINANTAVVMSESFRNQIVDSYGNKLKMTWWMMGGNIFRYATNNNIPFSNTMAMHLMKKYYGDKIEQWGDELSLHYHTFAWTDYDNDGKYWWNQAKSFLETKDDFNSTLGQFLLEEDIFPVSFRSGWHYMDNAWQNYLNEILPYSLHNDWPAVRYTTAEPINNVYNWSQASSEFIPFHPSEQNYQLQGNGKGWNVRSKYMGSVSQQMMNDIFMKANQGTDQLACFWSHLPDQNFLNEIQYVNTLVQQAATSYPNVEFKYCTAVEAFKLWRNSNDNEKPVLQIIEQHNGSAVKFQITTNEPIFQTKPFITVKNRYERYLIAESEILGPNSWKTVSSFNINEIGKLGVAVADTVGNLSTSFITFLPDDQFIDNGDPEYSEVYGNWTTSSSTAWNQDSRIAYLNHGDTAKSSWKIGSNHSGLHNIFVQFPQISNHIDTVYFRLIRNRQIEDTIVLSISGEFNKWLYVLTVDINGFENNFIEMFAQNERLSPKVLTADVLKVSAYVRDRQLLTNKQFIDLGEISIGDSVYFNIEIRNAGISDLIIDNLSTINGNIIVNTSLPKIISGFNKVNLPLIFFPLVIGNYKDTLTIVSNDPVCPSYRIPLTASVQKYFRIVDNEDIGIYSETGTWFKSVAQAYGLSSRYAYLQTTSNGPTATFTFTLNKDGQYDIFEILPKTVNSANYARYKILAAGVTIDSFYLNQNEGSGNWKNLGRYFLRKDTPISIKVIDSGESTSGAVIRADAFKIALFEETTNIEDENLVIIPNELELYQNYPNPFNPSTKIKYTVPQSSNVIIKVFDVLGNEIETLVNEEKPAGIYEVTWKATNLPSGVYFYRIQSGPSKSSGQVFIETKKMIMLR
jgi:hypothetical protein